jgi:trimeric autotransporter adhesin
MKKMNSNKLRSLTMAITFLLSTAVATSQSTSHEANSVPVTGNENVAIGTAVLQNNTNGDRNTATGFASLKINASGSENSAFGFQSLFNNTKGFGNTAIGLRSMFNNDWGGGNTAIGLGSLFSNVGGYNNTILGHIADVGNPNLNNATAIGYKAVVNFSDAIQLGNASVTNIYCGVGSNATLVTGGLQITGGVPGPGKVLMSDAVGVATWQTLPSSGGSGWLLGGNAGTVDGVNFIGTTDNVPFNVRVDNQPAGRIETDPNKGNTFWGYQSGMANTGLFNTGHGYRALGSLTTGRSNTAIGYSVLGNTTTGGSNTALGYHAMRLNTTGGGNTALGAGALNNNTTGSANVAIGGAALNFNTIGNGNTAIGMLAANSNTTGTLNTAVGAYTVVGFSNTNATALGAYANTAVSDNKVRIGGPAVTLIEGQVNFSAVSDGRFKENVSDKDVQGLAFVRKLRPVVYNFNTEKYASFISQDLPDSLRKAYMAQDFTASKATRQHGFIAQEVAKAAEGLGYDFDGVHKPINGKDYYSISYASFVVPLVKAVQEQQQLIETQSAVNEKMQQAIADLKKANEQLQASLQQQQKQLEALLAGKAATAVTKVTLEGQQATLAQNVPNPFAQQTGIAYHIPQQAGQAAIQFYTAAGRLVKTVHIAAKGNGVLQVQANELAAGIYHYALVIDGQVVATQKMAKQ